MGLLVLALASWLGLALASEGATNGSRLCQEAPAWQINGSSPMAEAAGQVTVVALLKPRHFGCLGGLRQRLSRQGMADVRYMIVNEQAPLSRAMFGELQRQAPPGVPVFQQQPQEPDVWQLLGGDKDDFLVYDRCGRLAFHIQLPYSFLHFPYVESAIRFTHSKDYCGNCSLYPNSTHEVWCRGASSPAGKREPSGDHRAAAHAHHHHGDHSQPHPKGQKQEGRDP
uniref:Selenoprotein P N-terminal domain-containing protein n=1 Tax=Anas platyrhynchos platyrhynchos TaxID=8840 RepID=A0A493SST1_ANAPP